MHDQHSRRDRLRLEQVGKLVSYKLTERDTCRWTTRDGREMFVSEMDSAHVANTIIWIRKHVFGQKKFDLKPKARPDDKKDGRTFLEWIRIFTLEAQYRGFEKARRVDSESSSSEI